MLVHTFLTRWDRRVVSVKDHLLGFLSSEPTVARRIGCIILFVDVELLALILHTWRGQDESNLKQSNDC